MLTRRWDSNRREIGRHPLRRRRVVFLSVVLAMACLSSSCAGGKVIGIKERIHHDDFEYSVTDFTTGKSIGSLTQHRNATGRYYIVTFTVENKAKRVNHAWDNSIAYMIDDQGTSHENLPKLQSFLHTIEPFNYSAHHVTPPGEIETTRFVFDLPANTTHPYLAVRGDFLMGDLFDGKAFVRTRVKLF